MPRFDSGSVFGRLLGDDAGHWSITAVDPLEVTRRYLDRTMVLETMFHTATGVLRLVDALAMGDGNRGHDLGHDAPAVLLRSVECLEGTVEVAMEYSPRPEYGLVYPLVSQHEDRLAAIGGADVLMLWSPIELELGDAGATARASLSA